MNRRSLLKNSGVLVGTTFLNSTLGIKTENTQTKDDRYPKKAKDWLIDGSHFTTSVEKQDSYITLSNGLVQRTFSIKPDCATVFLNNLMTGQSVLRSVRPEALIVLNGKEYPVGGLKGQPVQNYLSDEFLSGMTADPDAFHYSHYVVGETKERFPWKRNTAWSSQILPWPPKGKRLTFYYSAPENVPEEIKAIKVKIIYEMYDGIPVTSKWFELENENSSTVRLNRFVCEMLSVVETAPKLADGDPREYRIYGRKASPPKGVQADAPRDYIDRFTQVFVVTDYAMGGDMEAMKDNPGVHWIHDPHYLTGIQYYGERQPCLMECRPPYALGPDVDISGGETFESFHVFEMLRDSSDRERRRLAECRFWRMMAPWSQENPIFMHVREADSEAVKLAIDQCAEVGFELVIMTFGSGFHIEDKSSENLSRMKELADYARSKDIAIGGVFSLGQQRRTR